MGEDLSRCWAESPRSRRDLALLDRPCPQPLLLRNAPPCCTRAHTDSTPCHNYKTQITTPTILSPWRSGLVSARCGRPNTTYSARSGPLGLMRRSCWQPSHWCRLLLSPPTTLTH